MVARNHVLDDSSSSVMIENGKAMSRQKVVFGTRHDQPVKVPATASLFGWNTFVRFSRSEQQVRGDDQSPYQSWHSPLRWATSYAHEVAPLLSFKLFGTECDTHTWPCGIARTPKENQPGKGTQQKKPTEMKRKEKRKPQNRNPYVCPRPQKRMARKGQVEGSEPEVSREPSNTGS